MELIRVRFQVYNYNKLKFILNYELVKENLKEIIFQTSSSYSSNYFFLFRYEDGLFCEAVIEACMYRKKRGKLPRQNRYAGNLSWNLALRKEESIPNLTVNFQ